VNVLGLEFIRLQAGYSGPAGDLRPTDFEQNAGMFRTPPLTSSRIWLAFAAAIAADGFQVLLGPLGWTFFDEVIDVITMIVVSLLIGFHPLFLPTFVVEFIPVIDMLPTWSACVAMVVAFRKREQRSAPGSAASSRPPQIIDV